MKFIKQTFDNQRVLLDNGEFQDCTFKQCHLVFSATGGHSATNCGFIDCTWGFEGAAANTIAFMAAMYRHGGEMKQLIEATFENIRNNKVAAPRQ